MTDTLMPDQELSLADEFLRTRLPIPADRRRVRHMSGFSLRRFAQKIRVSHGSIAYYERGGQPGDDIAVRYKRELERLADLFGIEMRYEHAVNVQK